MKIRDIICESDYATDDTLDTTNPYEFRNFEFERLDDILNELDDKKMVFMVLDGSVVSKGIPAELKADLEKIWSELSNGNYTLIDSSGTTIYRFPIVRHP